MLGPIFFLIYISDLNRDLKSETHIYVDDSKLSANITNEDDIKQMQTDLDKVYEWARLNNMKFNELKFVLLRFGKDDTIKEDTSYFTEDMKKVITIKDSHRDLGIDMAASGNFIDHINNVIKSVRRRVGWICRTFMNRTINFMRSIYISLVRPSLDYCSQIWGLAEGPLMDKLEKT